MATVKVFVSQPMNGLSNEEDANPLWFLGEAIKKMSEADIAVFARGWHNARGCVVEHECARRYGVLMVGTSFTDLSLRGVDVYKLEKQQ